MEIYVCDLFSFDFVFAVHSAALSAEQFFKLTLVATRGRYNKIEFSIQLDRNSRCFLISPAKVTLINYYRWR